MSGRVHDAPREGTFCPVGRADHTATLSDEVGWLYQREAAERAVRHSRGVTGVLNTITIRMRSWSERRDAEQACWSGTCVMDVVNHLHIQS